MRTTHTSTHVWLHAWAETDVLARDERPGMRGMPRDGDPCLVEGCNLPLRAGERAVAVIEVPRHHRYRTQGEAWVGYDHPKHSTWRDDSGGSG